MIEDLGISLQQMMENAGRNLAHLAMDRWLPQRVTVLAGPGGNGGGGMVAARHLANRGVEVTVAPARDGLEGVPAEQAEILRRMGVPVLPDPPAADLVIDALIGYSLSGDPRGRSAELIEWANRSDSPILALDTPSGLDTTTGRIGDPCVRATATMTLALPKQGLYASPEVVGDLYLADISVPPRAYRAFGLEVGDLFGGKWVVSVSPES